MSMVSSTFSSISILPSQNPILSFISFSISPLLSRIPRNTVAEAYTRTRRRPRRKLPDKEMSVAVPITSTGHPWDKDDGPLSDSRNGKFSVFGCLVTEKKLRKRERKFGIFNCDWKCRVVSDHKEYLDDDDAIGGYWCL